MEIKARFIAVGIFTLAVVLAAFGFVLWKARLHVEQQFTHYDIYFQDTVAGLTPASQVQFNGIKVGGVDNIVVDPDNPSRVRVRIQVAANTPIRRDAVATLEPKGITGETYIQIEGGSADAPALTPDKGEDVAVITSKSSDIQEVFARAPQLLEQGVKLMDRLSKLVNEENRQRMGNILADAEIFAATLADNSQRIDRALADATRLMEDLTGAASRLEQLAGHADATLDRADRAFNAANTYIDQDLARTTEQLHNMAASIDQLTRSAGPGITAFTNEGLLSFRQFLDEARRLMSTLDRVAQRFESNPQAIIFGESVPEEELQ
ncbi:MlaD family protein [Desulfohalovibrio reitneri]|uniref:MlaD family protein n=1 Tax=Desulfohalovibrio reitneri TaxID=1307759 RepID=UPI00054D37B5|nr:MlaD family protein [Desulfohalovibrio reitneri]